ncbi:hypothetical protein MITS9509_03278 [Synechococcus sp. MIT S9509]|uniref:DUF2834 domain-containing protein n=1 Tax=unclassified Synechococcus TaxID=2626047 RepID=UPI0007BBF6A1|nr:MULTISPECIES: DUF2834 domain-containing protein [unclassified Synechococcus]KZR83456.1 hypothetical protein MITS9504_03278 [Synechococcus sp. MIT S9504]KZR88454.1 hypothetical protein MITS9509_03278 [Synechococcus sp. MIT S9509]
MRNVLIWSYLFLALLGAVLPWQANLEFIQAGAGTGFDLSGFIRDANLNAASRSLSRDLIIGATAFTIWITIEGRRLQVRSWWISLVLCVTVSFACGGPFFLYLRERRLLELEKETPVTEQND